MSDMILKCRKVLIPFILGVVVTHSIEIAEDSVHTVHMY